MVPARTIIIADSHPAFTMCSRVLSTLYRSSHSVFTWIPASPFTVGKLRLGHAS